MTPPDHDEPTRRIPAEPLPPRVPHEREVVAEEPAWVRDLADRIRSLRTWLALLTLLTLLALGGAAYAIVEATDEDEAGGRRPASAQRVSNLAERVDEL